MLALFHSKTAQAIGTWISVLTAVYAVIGMLIPEWFGHLTWPQLILMGLAAALATTLILGLAALMFGAGGALFRVFKPLAALPSVSPDLPARPFENAVAVAAYDDSRLLTQVTEIEGRLTSEMQGLKDKFAATEGRLVEAAKQARRDAALFEARKRVEHVWMDLCPGGTDVCTANAFQPDEELGKRFDILMVDLMTLIETLEPSNAHLVARARNPGGGYLSTPMSARHMRRRAHAYAILVANNDDLESIRKNADGG